MAKFRNVETTELWVPGLNARVAPGEVLTVSDDDAAAFLGAQWEPVGATKKAAKRAEEETQEPQATVDAEPAAGMEV